GERRGDREPAHQRDPDPRREPRSEPCAQRGRADPVHERGDQRDDQRDQRSPGHHAGRLTMWMASPSAAFAVSITPSPTRGCGWIVSPTSSASADISIASAASLIRSLACAPTIVTPRMSFVSAATITFTNPSVALFAIALPIAANGTLPIRTSRPLALHSGSV